MEEINSVDFYNEVRRHPFYLSFTDQEADKLFVTKSHYDLKKPTNTILKKSTSIEEFINDFASRGAVMKSKKCKELFSSHIAPDLLKTIARQHPMLAAQFLVNALFPTVQQPGRDHEGNLIGLGVGAESKHQAKPEPNPDAPKKKPTLEEVYKIRNADKIAKQSAERDLRTQELKVLELENVIQKMAAERNGLIESAVAQRVKDAIKEVDEKCKNLEVQNTKHAKNIAYLEEKISLEKKRAAQCQEAFDKFREKSESLQVKRDATIKQLQGTLRGFEAAREAATSGDVEQIIAGLRKDLKKAESERIMYLSKINGQHAEIEALKATKVATAATKKENEIGEEVESLLGEKMFPVGADARSFSLPYNAKSDVDAKRKMRNLINRKCALLLPVEERENKDLVRMLRYQLITSMGNAIAMTLKVNSNMGNILAIIENNFF